MSPIPKVAVLTPAEMADVDRRQMQQQNEWRSSSGEPRTVRFLDFDLEIHSGVFPPKSDTEFLARNLKIDAGAKVADIGTGSGALAIHAAFLGAERVLAMDISERALSNARSNVEKHSLARVIEVKKGDALYQVHETERFDVIIANLPGRNKQSHDDVSASQWDTDYRAHKALFGNAKKHLAPNGKVFMVKANYPELLDLFQLVKHCGYVVSIVDVLPPTETEMRSYHVLEISATEGGV